MIYRECLISEKQNNKASAAGGRLPKEAMLLRDIFKFTKPSLDADIYTTYIEMAFSFHITLYTTLQQHLINITHV